MHYLPEVGVIILTGIVVGLAITLLKAAGIDKTANTGLNTFSPTLFFVGLLPPIIFNGGFHLKRLLFFINIVPIMTFAIGGTLLSAAIIAGGLKAAISWGLVGGATAGPHHALSGVTWAECWAFGALISATDPVSTLVLFAELRVEPHLFYLVFGESVRGSSTDKEAPGLLPISTIYED
jgi:sodium/hydrogen exchanger 8